MKTVKSISGASEKIDAYILRAEPFAQDILKKIRGIIHSLDLGIEEEWKWASPVFSYKGLICVVWAFKKHASLHFFKGALLGDPYKVLIEGPGGNVSARSGRSSRARGETGPIQKTRITLHSRGITAMASGISPGFSGLWK